MMWAHCYRVNVGINTNMAIDSLNKLLKHNEMKGNQNIRVEKLLDLLDELVDEKMWKRILNNERPNANNYQHRTTVMAHKKAEGLLNLVQAVEFGKFQVKSSTAGEKFYMVCYNELCDEDCNKCKTCIHKYACGCPEYSVKTALCKHIHAVALYEKGSMESVLGRSESVSGIANDENSNDSLHIQEPTTSKNRYQNELSEYLNDSGNNDVTIIRKREREIQWEEVANFTKDLEDIYFQDFMDMFRTFKNQIEKK
jgi:hypothetical protein